jgi:nitroimidazol reductase NimA-like FMN-containing flavoprotein (pyridoxamine 5'-phosphate oxidase superfamily)
MRRAERQITDRTEIEAILRRAKVLNLAMADNGRPYVVPINYGYADGCLYFHGAREGRKMALLRRDPHVAFSVFCDDAVIEGAQACDWSSRYRSVVGEGRVEILERAEDKRRALDAFMSQFHPGPHIYKEEAAEKTCVFRVVITSMTGKKANLA